ncbi:MAG: hypothetical protein K0Q59_857 [Paenibacillus sp.]|jgi:nitrite reductase/ring-hydroxylating ferredoxin subunit|nr:hypothetical protein [Paenibacillus sp.]
MTMHQVARVGDVAPGKQIIVTVGKRQIGIFYEDDRYYAVLNVCPHAYAPICRGRVETPVLTDSVQGQADAQYFLDTSRKVLRCPWHHWEFELDTGKPMCDVKQRLKTYPVHIDGEWICLEL